MIKNTIHQRPQFQPQPKAAGTGLCIDTHLG